jgi:hypothetical protein
LARLRQGHPLQLDGDDGRRHGAYIAIHHAQGFEHSVVNMFVIPAGMLVGANVSFGDWWLWNQIPVTLGNIFGGFVFTGFALYLTHRRTPSIAEVKPLSTTAEMSAVLGR